MCVTKWLEEKIKDATGHKKLERLDLPVLSSKLATCKKALLEWRANSDQWPNDVNWVDERAGLRRRVDDWREAIRTLCRRRTALDEIVDIMEKERNIAKIESRKQRDRARSWLTSKAVCDAVAKSSGDINRSLHTTPHSVDIQLAPASFTSPCPLTAFDEPLICVKPSSVEANSRDAWQTMLAAHYTENKDNVIGKKKDLTDFMKKNKLQGAMATISPVHALDFPLERVQEDPQCLAGLKMIVWCKETFTYSVTVEMLKYRTSPMFITQYSMHSIIILLDPPTVDEHSDLQQWILSLDAEGLYRFPTIFLEEGSSLYVPMGWVPIVLSVPQCVDYSVEAVAYPKDPKSGAVQRHHALLGLTLFLSDKVAANQPPTVRRLTRAAFILNRTLWQNSLNSQAVGEFFESLQPPEMADVAPGTLAAEDEGCL